MSYDDAHKYHLLGRPTHISSRLEGSRHNFYLSIPGVGEYGGTVLNTPEHTMEPHTLYVEPHLRGNSIGTRLMHELVAQAKDLGIQTFRGHVESEYALDIKAQIFGTAALHYFDYEPYGEEVELPMSFEQARQSLVIAGTSEDDLENRLIGFNVEVDISGDIPK